MFRNLMPRFEPLSEEAVSVIKAGVDRLALELCREACQSVDESCVRFDPGFLRATAALAPAEFRMHARNEARDLVIGGDHMIFAPAQGPPFVRIGSERRDGTLADVESLLQLTHLTDSLDTPGRNILEPNDVPLDVRHLVRSLAAIRLTDRVWSGEPSSEEAAADCLRLAE